MYSNDREVKRGSKRFKRRAYSTRHYKDPKIEQACIRGLAAIAFEKGMYVPGQYPDKKPNKK
jgi:hypothetical protein